MPEMVKPNNITRLLDAHHIPYTAFELPAEKLGAQETARLLGVSAEKVFKTIVVTRENPDERPARSRYTRPILAVVPGTTQVELKKLARAVGEKKLYLPSGREAEQITGLLAGGISPLALLHHGFQVVIDELAQIFDEIHISGGQRGLNICLPVTALIELTGASLADISFHPSA
jgi:Cys-tRNA(Pro)/Cys-tRNA(Cys) deacylase